MFSRRRPSTHRRHAVHSAWDDAARPRTIVDTVPTALLVLVVVGLVVGDRAARRVGGAPLRPVDAGRVRRRGLVSDDGRRRLAVRVVARVRRRDRVPGVQLRGRQRPDRGGRPRRDRARQLRVRAGRRTDPDGDRRLRPPRRRRRMAVDAEGQGEPGGLATASTTCSPRCRPTSPSRPRRWRSTTTRCGTSTRCSRRAATGSTRAAATICRR